MRRWRLLGGQLVRVTKLLVHVHVVCVLQVLFLPFPDLIRDIKDPEHPNTLEELNVVNENCITVEYRTAGNEVRGAACPSSPDDPSKQGG